MGPSTKRRALLLDALRAGELDVKGLSYKLNVSPSTIRRYLTKLSHDNIVTRTYGGAIITHSLPEEHLRNRQSINIEQKMGIARAAAALIADGDVLILDAGSTVTELGRMLKGRRHRIITNNLALLSVFADEQETELIFLGGAFRATSVSTVGPLAVDVMRRMTADKVFLSADGVVPGRGLCEASIDQIALKSIMVEQARDVFVLADATKLSQANQWAWTRLPSGWTLVTDWLASEEQCNTFLATGTNVIRADKTTSVPVVPFGSPNEGR